MDDEGCKKNSKSGKTGRKKKQSGHVDDNEDSDRQRRRRIKKGRNPFQSQIDNLDIELDGPKDNEVF